MIKFARFLPVLQVTIAMVLVTIAIWKPYTLGKKLLWLGPSETVFIRNPMLGWLIFAQLPLMVGWLIFAKPKAFWQWMLLVVAVGAAIAGWVVTNDPPLYMG